MYPDAYCRCFVLRRPHHPLRGGWNFGRDLLSAAITGDRPLPNVVNETTIVHIHVHRGNRLAVRDL